MRTGNRDSGRGSGRGSGSGSGRGSGSDSGSGSGSGSGRGSGSGSGSGSDLSRLEACSTKPPQLTVCDACRAGVPPALQTPPHLVRASTKSDNIQGQGQRQMPSRVGGKEPSLGVPGPALCPIDPPARGAPGTMPYRAPPRNLASGAANDGRASFACGRPLVRSGRGGRKPLSRRASARLSRPRSRPPASHRRGRNPSNPPPTRPRRWGDAGPPKADRKAGAVRTET